MLAPHTKRIYLSPVRDCDVEILWKWRNTPQYMTLCSMRNTTISLEEYRIELECDKASDRHEQYLIIRKRDEHPIGTVFSYGFAEHDGHLFITCYIEQAYSQMGYGVDATALFGCYLAEEYGLHKIYADVYGDNARSLRLLTRFGFQEEGRFIGHRLVEGARRDIVRLACYQQVFESARKLVLRLGAHEENG